jgi:hypothetical protein
MKNRLLPCCFSALLLGFSLFLFSNLTFATGPDKTPGNDRIQKMRVNQVTGIVDPADVMKARLQEDKLSTKASAGLGLNWQSKGPGNFSGRSHVVIFDNRDATGYTLYTGGVTGGVWKTTNQGLTWFPVNTESPEVLKVTAMTQQASGTLYVGTGEWYCGEGSHMGTGLYRSDDGSNFTVIPGATPVANNPSTDWAYIKKLTVDPASGRLFAITNKGIRYSDNGNDWFTVRDGDASDVIVGQDGFVMIAVNDSVFISPNGSLTSFFNISTNTETTLPTTNVGKIEFAIAPSDPTIMYISIAKESDGFMLNVYRTEDKGATWSVIFPNNPTFEPFSGIGCAANTLAVLPNDPNKILLGGVNCWFGEQVLPTGFYNWEMVSEGISSILGSIFVPYNHYDYVFDPADQSKFAIASDNGVTIGTRSSSGFSFQTTNKKLLTSQMNSVAYTIYKDAVMGGGRSVGVQVIGALPANDPTDGVEMFAPLDWVNGTYCEWSMINPNTIFYGSDALATPYLRSDDLGTTPSPTFLGGISSTLTTNLPIRYWESFNYENTRDTVKYKAIDTIAAGETILVESSNVRFKFPYICPVNMVPGDSILVPDVVQSRFFIYGTKSQSGIFMTKDALKFAKDPAWFQLGETDPVVCMALSDDLNYLWAGTETGKLYRISNIALAYDSATADFHSPTCIVATESFTFPEFSGRYITSIAISPENNNTVLVTLGNYGNSSYVYASQNALDSLPSFTNLQGNLPDAPVFSSIFEMHGGNKAIIGTDLGVFSTDNVFSGQWTTDFSGLGNVAVTMLRQQTMNHYLVQNYGTLYAASFGNGLFLDNTFWTPLGTDPITVNNTTGSLKVVPNPATDKATVFYTLGDQKNVTLTLFDLTGRLIMQRTLGSQGQGDHSVVVDLSGLNSGTYVLKVNDAHAKVVKIQ